MKPVDCHCHLDFGQFDGDRSEVMERCGRELEFVVVAGTNPEHNISAFELREDHECVEATMGLHPTYTGDFDRIEEVKRQIRDHQPPAIGEIGLDHHHVAGEDRKKQEEVFREMLELAEELGKPVVVHSREAEERAVDILQSYSLDVMLHCFNGEAGLADDAAENGMKIGVTTQVLYSSRVQEIASKIELEDMLLETDSPFLYRGGRNEPVNVKESVEKIAGIKGVGETEVVEETSANARQFFSREL